MTRKFSKNLIKVSQRFYPKEPTSALSAFVYSIWKKLKTKLPKSFGLTEPEPPVPKPPYVISQEDISHPGYGKLQRFLYSAESLPRDIPERFRVEPNINKLSPYWESHLMFLPDVSTAKAYRQAQMDELLYAVRRELYGPWFPKLEHQKPLTPDEWKLINRYLGHEYGLHNFLYEFKHKPPTLTPTRPISQTWLFGPKDYEQFVGWAHEFKHRIGESRTYSSDVWKYFGTHPTPKNPFWITYNKDTADLAKYPEFRLIGYDYSLEDREKLERILIDKLVRLLAGPAPMAAALRRLVEKYRSDKNQYSANNREQKNE